MVDAFGVVKPPTIIYINNQVMYTICYTDCNGHSGTPFRDLAPGKKTEIRTWIGRNGGGMVEMTEDHTKYLEHDAKLDKTDVVEYNMTNGRTALALLPNHKYYVHGQAVPFSNLWLLLGANRDEPIITVIQKTCPNLHPFIKNKLYVLPVGVEGIGFIIVYNAEHYIKVYAWQICDMIRNSELQVRNITDPNATGIPVYFDRYWNITPEEYVKNILIIVKHHAGAVAYRFFGNNLPVDLGKSDILKALDCSVYDISDKK